ncbi:hypothetical protein CVT25_010272 [Psilocybe cyanescens]|uniref:Nephrocystin 3-like N-terminal domain-containing protein n=1 Tax=Psilocybe cyanescens TaxID=93625 RepID=A0A409X2T0_PSICY|nr:hypothetical protein CVT25_010272 [Psilocybe cyanescens]
MPSMFSSHTVIAGGNYQQFINDSKGAWDLLVKAASPAAFHNSGDRRDPPKCHPNTRIAVLKKIMDWIHGLDPAMQKALIMWVYGPAGAGKSAIAQSIAELCYDEGILIASYFFSRFDSTRNHPRSLIATIAYQASLCIPNIREHINAAIDHDPLIFTRSLTVQMSTLVIQPLEDCIRSDTAAPARVIIIDGLDECEDRQGQVEILATISKALQQHGLPFIFLITSRPEHDIRTAFGHGYLKDITERVPLDDEYLPSDDIRVFLQDSFSEIKETHPFHADIVAIWPGGDILESLVEKSSGQFIYASTVIKFVKSSRHRPPQRLEIVLGLRPVQRDIPFAELDALYMHILSSAENPEAVLQILAYHFLTQSVVIMYQGVDLNLFSLFPEDVFELFCDLTSLVSVTVDRDAAFLDIFHASLEDFLLDQSRSQQFWIDSKIWHAKFAHLYIHYGKDTPSSLISYHVQPTLLSHFENATATPDLLEDLRQISIWSIYQKPRDQMYFPKFLDSIANVGFQDWFELRSHQLHIFDQYTQKVMEQMYFWRNLTALVAVYNLGANWKQWDEGAPVLFLLHKRNRNLDKLSFNDVMNWSGFHMEFIGEFFKDSTRCGTYGLTGRRSATPKIFPAKKIKQHALRSWERDRPYRLPRACSDGFLLALHCLSFVLCKADRSEDLIALARQRTFWLFSLVYPRHTRNARREIARYLTRVDAGEISVQEKRNGEQPSEPSPPFPPSQSYACPWDCSGTRYHYEYVDWGMDWDNGKGEHEHEHEDRGNDEGKHKHEDWGNDEGEHEHEHWDTDDDDRSEDIWFDACGSSCSGC